MRFPTHTPTRGGCTAKKKNRYENVKSGLLSLLQIVFIWIVKC